MSSTALRAISLLTSSERSEKAFGSPIFLRSAFFLRLRGLYFSAFSARASAASAPRAHASRVTTKHAGNLRHPPHSSATPLLAASTARYVGVGIARALPDM